MITKVQSTQNNQPAFTAKWPDVRKVIANLPEKHDFFSGLNYTLDHKTVSTKEVLLARLDKFVEVFKEGGYKKKIFDIAMPDFSNIYKNPKKFWKGLRQEYLVGGGSMPYAKMKEYDFTLTKIRKMHYNDLMVSERTYKDSLGAVANLLVERGIILSKALKKAGLENPKEIEI